MTENDKNEHHGGYLVSTEIKGKDDLSFSHVRYSEKEDGKDIYTNRFSQTLIALHDMMKKRKEIHHPSQKEPITDDMLLCIRAMTEKGIRLFRWSTSPVIFNNPTPTIKSAFSTLNSAIVLTNDGTLKATRRLMFNPDEFYRYQAAREIAFNIAEYDNRARFLEQASPQSLPSPASDYMGPDEDWIIKSMDRISHAFNASLTLIARTQKLPSALFQGGGESPDSSGYYPVRGILKNRTIIEKWNDAVFHEFGEGYKMLREEFIKSLNPEIIQTMKKGLLSEVGDYNWLNGGTGNINGKEKISAVRLDLVNSYPSFASFFINPDRKMADILFEQENAGSLDLSSIERHLAEKLNPHLASLIMNEADSHEIEEARQKTVQAIQRTKGFGPSDFGSDHPFRGNEAKDILRLLGNVKFSTPEEELAFSRQSFATSQFVNGLRQIKDDFDEGAYPNINETGVEQIGLANRRFPSVFLDFEQIFTGIIRDKMASPGFDRQESREFMFRAFCGHDSIPVIAKRINRWYETRLTERDGQPPLRQRESSFSPPPIPSPEQNFPLLREGAFMLPSGVMAEFVSTRKELQKIEAETPALPASSLGLALRGGNCLIHIKRRDNTTIGLLEADWNNRTPVPKSDKAENIPTWVKGIYASPEQDHGLVKRNEIEIRTAIKEINKMVSSNIIVIKNSELSNQKMSASTRGQILSHFDINSEKAMQHNMAEHVILQSMSTFTDDETWSKMPKNFKSVEKAMNFLNNRDNDFSQRVSYLENALERHNKNMREKQNVVQTNPEKTRQSSSPSM